MAQLDLHQKCKNSLNVHIYSFLLVEMRKKNLNRYKKTKSNIPRLICYLKECLRKLKKEETFIIS